MMFNYRRVCIFTILFSLVALSRGQEFILPLESDPGRNEKPSWNLKKAANQDTLELPFVDDFSYNHSYPDFTLWADDYAYVNRNYGFEAPTIGVATMDALDWNGAIYPFATIYPETFDADFLTSQPINLNYNASDSIYLSFYYQPMGNGLQPNPEDSLCVDFYDAEMDTWINIWNVSGDTLKPFRLVMIPILDDRFLKKGFRFGFRNKASLPKNSDYSDKRGNVDHWNIDYVLLDKKRNVNDTVFRDVAFFKPISSMLKGYESIPWDHFESAYNSTYLPYFRLEYINNDTIIRNVTRSIQVYDEVWNKLYRPNNASAQDIFPDSVTSFQIASIYPFDFGKGDTASFLVKSWLRTDDFDRKENDTITRRQIFRDYFAYDDGSAERAYGLRGQGSKNGLIAVRFNSFIPDELGGIDLYFTQLKDSINLNYYFKLMVWDDNDGLPGDIIYNGETDYTVSYSDNLNNFTRYNFEHPVPVNGVFYVGLLQYNQYMLNIGLDINTNTNSNLLYNIGQDWLVSSAPGNIMLRPFIKRTYLSDENLQSEDPEIKIWPNPASERLHISFNGNSQSSVIHIKIYNTKGAIVKSLKTNDGIIDISNLSDGMYLISLSGENQLYTKKIIIRN